MKVQLGFAVDLNECDEDEYFNNLHLGHRSPNWSNWDGGKIGGIPSWLNPRDLPKKAIYCDDCYGRERKNGENIKENKIKMRFIGQLYCPLDDDENKNYADAFHRTLYVFVCPNKCHSDTKIKGRKGGCGGVRILRCQLPRKNPFYPYDVEDDIDDLRITTVNHLSEDGWGIHLCHVCGQLAKGKCSKQKKWFCDKECQKEYLKYTKKDKKNGLATPSLYQEMELVVEEEPNAVKSESFSDTNKGNEDFVQKIKDTAWFKNEDEDDINDADLDQKDLNKMTGVTGTTDPATLYFFQRIDRVDKEQKTVKDQCIRYQRWKDNEHFYHNSKNDDEFIFNQNIDGPIWISSQNIPTSYDDIPTCPYCNGQRKFEFQIMPQMLHYLQSTMTLSTKNNNQTNISEDAKNAVLAMSQIREKNGDKNIKPEYIQNHEKALSIIKNDLLQTKGTSRKNDMDWGSIAIYTCVNSCTLNTNSDDEDLGAYREEFGWRQPPLD